MYKFILSLCIVAVAFLVQRFANQIDEQLNACGTGVFKDGVCECQHPYTGAHCEIVDCGYGKLIDSAFAYDTITTPKGPAGCECENQYWGYNCANCTSTGGSCTGTCENNYYGSRCEIMCKSGTENDKYGVEHREAGGTYNYFKDTHGFCLNYGDVRGEVQCREGRAGAHCQHECLDCLYGSCNSEDGTCDCFDGYTGTLCELTCPGRCSGLNGVCKQADTQPVCDCYPGFTGEDCSLECCVEDRGTELSSVHGTCAEGVGGCDCFEEVVLVDLPDEVYSTTPFHGVGWEGSQCDCHENITCGGRGRCVEGGCECTANFQGARCDICADDKIGPFCQHERWQCPDRDNANGEFVAKNSRGDYACKCNSGFTGDTCEECIASAYPKTGDNMCSMIIPTSLCNGGSVNPNYDGSDNVAMCICDQGGHFDVETNCGSCSLHYYGPDCDYYCRESTTTDALDCGSTGGVCSNSGPGCICPKGTTFSGTKAGGTCVTCGGDEGCINGNCIEGRCRCDPNYYGDNCDITAPISGDKVCSGYPSVIIETAANCDLTADCLDDSEDAPVPNQLVAHQARIYDRLDQMFCHRDDTPKGLKNTQGCCVDKNGDGFCDKDKLQSTDCSFINAAGNVEEGEVVNDICNKRVLEDETNVFEWCLSKEKDCTSNGVCEDPELCENRCDAGLGPAEWVKIWEWEHSRTMTDVMSESWKFASDFPDPYEYRKSYTYQNPCPASYPRLKSVVHWSGIVEYFCYEADTSSRCHMYSSGIPNPEGGQWGWTSDPCILGSKSTEPFPALDANIDDVCVAGEMYDVCRDYLIPDDANVFNLTHKFTDKWEPMPNYQDCTLTKVISVNVDGKVVIPIDPIYAGILETTEDNTAVFGRYNDGDAAYTGNVNHMIDSISVFGKGFTGANKLSILIYNYTSDTCSDFVKKVGSHHAMCSQIKFYELDYDWGAFCKWRPTSLSVYATRMSTTDPKPVMCDPASVNSIWSGDTWTGCEGAQWHGGGFAQHLCDGSGSYFQPSSTFYSGAHILPKRDYYEACCDWTGSACVEKSTEVPSFDDRCYRQSSVCTTGCDNYQEGCEGLPLISEFPTPMPAPCDQHWDDFCTNYMDFEHKEEGVCAYTECRCEGYGIGGPACDMQCPVPAGVDTELSCGSDLNMGRCIKDRGVIAFGVEQGKCDCFNGGNPAEGCAATCNEDQDCSRQIDTPFSFEYENCTALADIDDSKTVVDLNGAYTCHVFLRDSACNFFRGRCECATPFTAYTEEEKPIYLNPHSSYRIALMQGYEIDEYLPFTNYNGTVPDRDREAFDDFDPNFKCYKDLVHSEEVSCDWIRALKHFARGGSYRIGDCTNLAPGTDIEYQEPCSGHGFPQGGTCACDYAEEFETRSSGVGLSFEQPGLTETPWRGKACQFVCPGYDMKTMSSVCSGHGRCESDARCACDQGWTGYKCDLQCEAEQKPLTCSGHGVCDERSIVLRGDIVKQLDNARCDHLPECNVDASGPCTNETMTLARDRVIKSGDSIYHMYFDKAIKITTYDSGRSYSVEFVELDTTSFTVKFGDSFELNPDINVCSDFTLKKSYKDEFSGGPVILTMRDSYGDGWNGFRLSVNGITYGSTFTSGTRQTKEISGLTGTIDVNRVASGLFLSEVSFEIRCKEGSALLLTGDGSDSSWTFENMCPTDLTITNAIVIRKESTVVATLTEIGEFSVSGAEVNDVYTYSDISSSIGGSLTVIDCSAVTRNAVLDDFSIEGTAVRHDYDFGSDIPFMPCQDRMSISREHPAHPLLPEMSSVDLECNMFAQKQVTENGADYFKSYQIMCGVCNCEESSQTGNWTGYDCRTPALGFYRYDARSQCPGMTADMNPCNGGGTCRWGSTDGLGTQIRVDSTRCYCGDVTDEATLETAPRSEYGVLVHASSHGTPLFYDEIDTFEKKAGFELLETDAHCASFARPAGPSTSGWADPLDPLDPLASTDRAQECANRCSAEGYISFFLHLGWGERCMCGTNDCSSRTKYPERASYTITSNFGCPAGTEPIQYAEDCLHGFKTDEPFSLIPSFQYCEMPDKSDQVVTLGEGQTTGSVDEITFNCYDSCINGQKMSRTSTWSDPLFWSKYTKEDVTHFSVITDGIYRGWCVCYATNVDDCKDGDADVPLTSYPHEISYRINHHSHPYDLTTGSYRTIPTLSSLTTGSCQKEFADEVFADKVYRPTISYKASSSVCEEVFEIDGTSVTIENAKIHLGNVYSTRLQETDPLYDRDPSQECANRCDAKANGYDGLMIVSYAPKGNINSCLCGKKCDTPQAGHPYLKMYSMRTVPDPYETDKSQSICHPSPLQLSNYKSDCSCKFGFTGNTCETARMMCLWNGEETDGTECICNDDGELNTKVSKYGCCTKGTYWEQDKYASFTPLSEFEPLPANRFYEDAFLYVCKPPETLLDYESDRERIIDIHNYVANTDEYLLTKPAVCGNAPEKQLFTSTLQTLTSKSPDTFTVTRDTRTIVVDKDKTILELKEGSEPKEQCASFCVSKNKGYKGFSIFTPTPEMVKTSDKEKPSDAGAPNVWCTDDDYVMVYNGWASGNEDPNPGRQIGSTDTKHQAILDACWAGCTFRPRVSKTKQLGYADSRPQNFWDVYGPDDISYIRVSNPAVPNYYGSCSCHTGDLDNCESLEEGTNSGKYKNHNYKVVRGDTECTCEPFIANMDHQTEFKDPMSYDDNEGWTNAIPRTTERYDIQFPVDIEAEAQNLGCFENIDGRVLKIDQLSGTSHSISAVETAYIDVSSARSSVGGTFEDCYEECKYDDVFTYGFIFPELPRYNFEGKGSCLALDSPFSSTDVSAPFGHSSWVYQVSFSPDGSRFLSASRDRYVRVRDTSTGSVLRTMYTGYYVYSAAWSPDGSKIVSTAQDNKVRVWDSKTGALISTLSGHYNMVFSVSFSPDGQKIVSWSSDATIVWSTETWEKLTTKSGFKVFSFSPTGTTGTTGTKIVSGFDKYVVVTDFEQGTELMRLQGHTMEVTSVSFSPDGSKIVSGSNDKTVRVWDSQTGAQLKNLTGHTGEVNSVVFSPDGSHIVSGSSDKTVRVWDTQTGGLLTTLGGHSKGVLSVSFSPNGTHIVSGSYDNTVRVWSRSLSQGDYLESSVASDASECYKNCRYKAGFSGFVFKPVDDRCVCTTTNQVGCVTKNQLYDRYSVNEDYMHFTEFSDSYCDSNLANYENARVRPYAGTTFAGIQNPGEDQAAIIRACHEACVDIDGDNIIDSEPLYQNKDYWDEYTGSDATAFYTRTDGRCYCIALLDQYDQSNCEAQSGSGNLGAKWLPGTEAYEWRYKRNPLPEEKTCTCYSGGRDQINSKAISDVFQVTGTSVGTLMTVQKNPAVNPAPCNVNSYIALGDDIVGDPCNCPIGALEEAYVDVGFERAIVNGRCEDYTHKTPAKPTRTPLPMITGYDHKKFIPRCASDCNLDTDCVGHMKCFQRNSGDPGPTQCTGTPYGGHDYCYDPYLEEDVPYYSTTFHATPPNLPLGRCMADCDEDKDCGRGLVCYQRGYVDGHPVSDTTSYANYMSGGNQFWHCNDFQAPRYGPKSGSWGLKITDTSDPFYEENLILECARRCRDDGRSTTFHTQGGRCACGCFDGKSFSNTWGSLRSYVIVHSAAGEQFVPGCTGSIPGGYSTYDICVPAEWSRVNPFAMSEQRCQTTCENDPHCDSYSYAPEDDLPCRTAIDCAGFEYKFEGLCGWGSPSKPDIAVGVLPNIKACRDRCADYKGFAYSESYRNCMCQDYEMTGEFHSLCGNGGRLNDAPNTVEQWTRYQHNFQPAAPGEDATIKVRQPLTASKGRYCATGEEELYTVSITDPRADVYACAQNATLQGMEVARGSVNGLTFTCYVSNTYYAVGDTEAGIAPCGDFKETGGPQYILQAGMQRRIGIELATVSYQNKAIKDDLFNKEIYLSDTPEGCKVHCDPYKYRHFQFSNRDKTCQCIKKEKSLLTLTGDPNDMNYEIYDFSAGLIDSPHEMCFCEGFYLVDGQAQACPAGKYSSKLTPCSAACTNCPIGQFSDAGASECGACVAGQIQTSPTSCSKCPAGKFARSGDIVCRVCEIGTYSIGVGAGRCTLCPTGKFQDPAVVGTTTNTCKDCPEGWEQPNMEQTDCKFCGVGKYTTSEGTAECLVCSSGKYQNQNEQKSADACHDCSAGKYQEQTGKSSCKNCAAGKYQSQTGKTSCPSCSAGKYQGQTGKTSCVTCGAGKFSAAGALSCATCGAGKYSRAGSSTCSACNAGYYQTGAGQGSCTLCPAAATPNYKLGRFWNDVSRWGSVSGYGYSFHYPNPDRTKIDSCLYVQKGDYDLQGSNSAEGFNYDKVHCRYASQKDKINGYIKSKYVLRWCWIDRGNCRDVVNGRLVNYDLTETGRTNGVWKQCKPYHKGYRL